MAMASPGDSGSPGGLPGMGSALTGFGPNWRAIRYSVRARSNSPASPFPGAGWKTAVKRGGAFEQRQPGFRISGFTGVYAREVQRRDAIGLPLQNAKVQALRLFRHVVELAFRGQSEGALDPGCRGGTRLRGFGRIHCQLHLDRSSAECGVKL
ncbi:MAG TPA: hypothetical protein VE959_08405 [Bryobacteraceae bacterium]|nr:hypothetical protein [Bryobacteraceae bacterium]